MLSLVFYHSLCGSRTSVSRVKKVELFDFMKETRNKEEYRRASAIKQKLEGLPYRAIARNLDVNYRNVYNWIKEYKEYGLDGIRSKRKNAGRIPKISSDKNKERVKEIIMLIKNEPYRTMNREMVERKYKKMERESNMV
jgi:transposase